MEHIFPFLSQTRKMFSILMLGLLLISHFPAQGLGNFPSASRAYPSLVSSSVEKTITGVVLDGRTREPLIGATISLKGTTQGTTTDLDGRFSFSIPDEASAMAQDETCEEEILVLAHDFDLHELVEDELLLELPYIARHDSCPAQPKMVLADPDFVAEPERPNPFAALAALRTPKGP